MPAPLRAQQCPRWKKMPRAILSDTEGRLCKPVFLVCALKSPHWFKSPGEHQRMRTTSWLGYNPEGCCLAGADAWVLHLLAPQLGREGWGGAARVRDRSPTLPYLGQRCTPAAGCGWGVKREQGTLPWIVIFAVGWCRLFIQVNSVIARHLQSYI